MIFLGCLISDNEKQEVYQNSKKEISEAASNFQNLLIEGFAEHGVHVNLINALPVGSFPKHYKKIFLKHKSNFYKGIEYSEEVASINLPLLKQYSRYRSVLKLLKRYKTSQDIIIYSSNLFYLKALSKLKVKHNVTAIITDLPEYWNLSKTNTFLYKLQVKLMYKYLKNVDKFVFLTSHMAEKINVGERKYIVIEGLVDNKIEHIKNDVNYNSKKYAIMYSGALHEKFGIKKLVDAVMMIQDSNIELLICGSGEMSTYIKKMHEIDSRINYLGQIPRSEVLALQRKVNLLVNPRPNEGEYVKYSFPSKTMEYMLSGTPVLMYRLDGVPDEYSNYLFYVEGNDVEDLKNAILKIKNMKKVDVVKKGQDAIDFVISQKNNLVQTKKIIDLIKIRE